jgi:TPR repeat protein
MPGSGRSPDKTAEAVDTPEPVVAEETTALPLNNLEELARLREALHVDPDGKEPRLRVANLLYQMGDSEAAIDEYRTLLRFHPDAALGHLGLGIALMAKQEWKTALSELQEAARLDPGLVQPHFSMGTIHYTRGSPLAAAKSYREALRLKPDFAEAHYRLGLVLKMAGQDKEAVQEFEIAALRGIAKAQLFLGNAYKSGHGVEKNQVMAITWWSRAFEQGLPEAAQALAQLRRLAAARQATPTKQAKAAAESFQEFCNQLWLDFPDLEREHPDDTVGVTLLKHGRTGEALPVLLREAYALNERSHAELVRLYEEGLDGQLPKHGQWILTFLESTAADGARPSRAALARIYGLGLGVEQDMAKAKGFLKGLPKDEANALLDDITAVASQS